MITETQLNSIGELVRTQPVSEKSVARLRSDFPGIHFTYCMDEDVVGASPVFEDPAFNLYLVDSSDHCLRFTQEMEVASGLVLAEIEAQ